MHTLRTKFKNEILTEFLPPKRKQKTNKVILFCSGAPSSPGRKQLLEFWSNKGYWVFLIRYRGSWESSGKFLALSPEQDVLDVIEEIPKGFAEAWDQQKFKFNPDQIIVMGGSFGGPAAILSSLSSKVDKAIAVSPVIDWRKMGPDEPYPKMIRFFEEAFGQGYRFVSNGWDKLKSGKFYNPINDVNKIDPKKLIIFHAKDDRTCLYRLTHKFCSDSKVKLYTFAKGGHLGLDILMKPSNLNRVNKLLNS